MPHNEEHKSYSKPVVYHDMATIESVNRGIPYYVSSPTWGYEGKHMPVAGSVSNVTDCDEYSGKLIGRVSVSGSIWVTCTESSHQFNRKFKRCSLSDNGVIHQSYTDRLAFLTEESAIRYARTGKTKPHKGKQMKNKIIKKLKKYAIDLSSGDRQTLKEFIESKGWPIYSGTNAFSTVITPIYPLKFNGEAFLCTSTKYVEDPITISIPDFIAKFSKPDCKQRIAELQAELDKYKSDPDEGKDWRDAFLEDINIGTKVEESLTGAIKINHVAVCTFPQALCAYVATFTQGGFWFTDKGLYFVTNGSESDPKATYKHAKKFIADFKAK